MFCCKLTIVMMKLFFSFILTLVTFVSAGKLYCNQDNAIKSFKRPTYDFSVGLLDRVAQETGYHFVFSPLSTWLHLMTLAEGARGSTEEEIRKVTKYNQVKCFRRKYREVINSMDVELSLMTKRTNYIIINELLDVKKTFRNEVSQSKLAKVLSLDFNDPEEAAKKGNKAIQKNTDGIVEDSLQAEDFNLALLLMTETTYFKSEWQTPFNPVYTTKEPFYDEHRILVGNVSMMTQAGYFNLTPVPLINARVLELPFNSNDRLSMLLFLPTRGSVKNLSYKLKDISLTSVYSLFKSKGKKLVTVRIPRFNISTEVQNIPELIHDMRITRIFDPNIADFRGISDYKIIPSFIQQMAHIEVTENGASAVAAENLSRGKPETFTANRPFLYLIVDKKTDIILFGGIYSDPNVTQ